MITAYWKVDSNVEAHVFIIQGTKKHHAASSY